MRNYAGLERIIYKMFDYGDEDLATTHPEWGEVGSYNFFCWDWLHSDSGQYNFGQIERWLLKLASKRRPSGAPQSGVMKIITHISGYPDWPGWRDCTPTYIYRQWDAANPSKQRPTMRGRKVGHIVMLNGQEQAVPGYEDTGFWWTAYRQFVEALGRWYASLLPEIKEPLKAIFFGAGIDGESQATKSGAPDPSGIRFGQLCEASIGWWDQAFPDLPLFMVTGPGQGSLKLARLCYARGIGIKNNGLQDDVDSSKGYSWKDPAGDALEDQRQIGLWDAQRWALQVEQPVWLESSHNISAGQRAMAAYHALHFRPVGIDLHSEWLQSARGEDLDMMRLHMNRGAGDAPGAWCRLRDTDHPLIAWTSRVDGIKRGYGGHPGNFEYLLHMEDGADAPYSSGLGTKDDPKYEEARRIRVARFTMDPGFAPDSTRFVVRVRWLDEPGQAINVSNGQLAQVITGDGSGRWRTDEAVLATRSFVLESAGGAAVALVHVAPEAPAEPGEEGSPPGPSVDVEAVKVLIEQAESAMLAQAHALSDVGSGVEQVGKLAEQIAATLDRMVTAYQQTAKGYGEACDQLGEINRQLLAIRQAIEAQGEGD